MNRVRVAFVFIVGAIGCGAIAGGAMTNVPDWVVKGEQADQRRQDDIAAIAQAVSQFQTRKKELPYDLSKIAENQTDGAPQLNLNDSETAQPYDYERVDSRHYKLCANFTLASLRQPAAADGTETAQAIDPWRHPAGVSCFLFDGEAATPTPVQPSAEAKG